MSDSQLFEVREEQVYPNSDGADSHFELADDEILLDSYATRHGQTSATVTLVIGTPTTHEQCLAVTADDTRCQRDATEDSNYCSLSAHGPESNE
jgi:hypothetical protein